MNTNTTSVWRKKLKELEIVVVIPTYNNGKTLAAVIEEVYRYADDIIVINDGSTDDTANILEQYPAIRTITHPVNKGKGTALKHGLSQAKKRRFPLCHHHRFGRTAFRFRYSLFYRSH